MACARGGRAGGREPQQARAHRGGRSGSGGTNTEAKGVNKDHLALTLRLARGLAQVEGATYDTLKCKSEDPIIVASAAAGKGYHESVKANPKHTMGPPHPYVAAAGLKAALSHPKITEEIKAKLARLDQVEAELKAAEEAALSNKGAAMLMSQLINAGVVKQEDEATVIVQ